MRHAVMVLGYGEDCSVLQSTINFLDDPDISFFIHWDKKYKIPKVTSQKSPLVFVENRIDVKWGSFSLIEATVLLLKKVKSTATFDYVHLISSNDIPLMTKEYFKNYFTKDTYIGFQHVTDKEKKRIQYYFPNNLDFRKHRYLYFLMKKINDLFRINRLKHRNINVEKGCEWFSIKYKFIDQILSYDLSVFAHGYCADELFMQTIFATKKPKKISNNDNFDALRYIDWKRGAPYTFTSKDIKELQRVINTNFAFGRKISDSTIIKKIFINAKE